MAVKRTQLHEKSLVTAKQANLFRQLVWKWFRKLHVCWAIEMAPIFFLSLLFDGFGEDFRFNPIEKCFFVNRLKIRQAVPNDTGNYTCVSTIAQAASVYAHVISGKCITLIIFKISGAFGTWLQYKIAIVQGNFWGYWKNKRKMQTNLRTFERD